MSQADDIDAWFKTEVLPLEKALTQWLRHYVRGSIEVKDLRQEVYVRLYEMARDRQPVVENVWRLSKSIARNLIIDHARKSKVISIEVAIAQEDDMIHSDLLTPERYASDRDELRRFERGVEALPSRCRQAIRLRKIEGLSQRECARRMGITEGTLESQVHKGMRLLTDFMLGGVQTEGDRKIRARRMFWK